MLAVIDRHAVQFNRAGTAAKCARGFKDGNGLAVAKQFNRGGKPGVAGADDGGIYGMLTDFLCA